MKIDKLQNDRNVKLVAHIPETTNDELTDYRKCYQEKYGADISESKLIGAMLQRFMADDVDFQRWKKVQKTPKPVAAQAGSSAAPAPANAPFVESAGSDDAQQF